MKQVKNNFETKPIKQLALLALQRNKDRNNNETTVNNFVSNKQNNLNQNEIIEEAKYLFFERLGISDNEELAFQEAINHLNKNLTIN